MRLAQVPIATLAAFMEACLVHPSSDVGAIASFAGFSVGTARRALPSLETLNIVQRDEDGVYRTVAERVSRSMGIEAASLVIRRALQGYRPFEMLCEGLALGESARLR